MPYENEELFQIKISRSIQETTLLFFKLRIETILQRLITLTQFLVPLLVIIGLHTKLKRSVIITLAVRLR